MAWDPVDAARAQLARLRRTLRSIDVRDAKVATGAACVGLGLGMLMAGARDRRALRRLTAVVKTAEAEARFRSALQINPRFTPAQNNLQRLLRQQ